MEIHVKNDAYPCVYSEVLNVQLQKDMLMRERVSFSMSTIISEPQIKI